MDPNLSKRKYEDDIVTLQQVVSQNKISGSMVQTSNIWPRNQVICMNEDRLRQELAEHTPPPPKQQIFPVAGNHFTTEGEHGPMKVFIINQPVKNVIRAGNNLIVETEPTRLSQMQPASEKDQEIENISNSLKNETIKHMEPTMAPSFGGPCHSPVSSTSEDDRQKLRTKNKTKKKPVPTSQKDAVYWERRRKNNLAAKRSRESRRNRDNQTTMRTSMLETENMELRDKINDVRSELLDVKEKLQEYNIIYRGTGVDKMALAAASSLPNDQ